MRRTRAGIAVVLALLVLSLTNLTNITRATAEVDQSEAAACLSAGNVWVVVQDDKGITGGCATKFGDGLEALTSAGFQVTELWPGFICQINGSPSTCDYDPDFWAYYTRTQAADATWDDWVFSNDTADGSSPTPGSVEGWRLVPLTGTWQAPDFTPPAVTLPPPTTPTGQPVTIPDEGLRACLASTLRQAPSATITDQQLATITELECFFAGIKNLTGAEYLTGLTRLDLSLNDVVNLAPLAGLTQLQELVVDGNDITDLTPLAGLTGLRTLDLDGNRISDLGPISGLVGLTSLTATSQQKVGGTSPLTSLAPVQGLVNLTHLGVGGNAITSLSPVAGLTKLQTLLVYSNQISDLTPVQGLTTLTELNIHTNLFTSLVPLSGLTALVELNARSNQLTTVAGLPTSLVDLDLSNNTGLTDHQALARLVNLTDLGLENTALTDAGFITQLPKLNWFIAHRNGLTDLSPMAGRSWRGWGVLQQAPTLTATIETLVDLGLRDQTGAVINPDVLRLPDGVIPLGDGKVMFTEPGTYVIPFAESSSGGSAKFAGTLTVTAQLAPTEPPPSTEPAPSTEPVPTTDPAPTTEPAPTTSPAPSTEPQPSTEPSTPPSSSRPLPSTGDQSVGIVGLVVLLVAATTGAVLRRR